jgi:hypothetical protein
MKKKIILFILICGLSIAFSYAQVDNKTKHKMFCEAGGNFSTAPNYVVIVVKNLKTGEVKEVCTESPFVSGAIGRETGKFFLGYGCDDYPDRYFEFSNDSALWNIGFDTYTIAELDSFELTIDVPNIVDQVKSGNLISKTLYGTRKEQRMFAHLMFNNGVMMTRGCFAGNICGLSYFKDK